MKVFLIKASNCRPFCEGKFHRSRRAPSSEPFSRCNTTRYPRIPDVPPGDSRRRRAGSPRSPEFPATAASIKRPHGRRQPGRTFAKASAQGARVPRKFPGSTGRWPVALGGSPSARAQKRHSSSRRRGNRRRGSATALRTQPGISSVLRLPAGWRRATSNDRPAARAPRKFLCSDLVRQLDYFFSRSSTTLVIATIPVRIVGSGTGRNLLECNEGRLAPVFFASATFSGATAPTLNMKAGIE